MILPSLLLRKMFPFWIVPVVIPLGSVRNTFPPLIVPNVISPLPVLRKTLPPLMVPNAMLPLLSWKYTLPLLIVPVVWLPLVSLINTVVLWARSEPQNTNRTDNIFADMGSSFCSRYPTLPLRCSPMVLDAGRRKNGESVLSLGQLPEGAWKVTKSMLPAHSSLPPP